MDIILFQTAIAISLLVFFAPIRIKYFAILLPMLAIIGITSIWAIDVIVTHKIKIAYLSFNLSENIFGFWSAVPKIKIDQISALFILMINVISIGSLIYAYGYLKKYLSSKSALGISMHYFSFFLLYISLLLLTMIRDGFLFLFLWELMSLSSFVLIAFDGEKAQVRAVAINYLIQMHIGFMLLLAGFLIANKATGIWGFDALPIYFSSHPNTPLFFIFFLGFAVKAGLMPFHTWAPKADPIAPPHVSALMSGVLVKIGCLGIMRVAMSLQNSFSEIASILLAFSLITIVFSISMSVYEKDLRKLLAYSSIENVGVICLGLSLSIFGTAYKIPALAVLGILGSIFHVFSHSLYKSTLFLLTGNVERISGTRNINELGGLAKKMPLTAFFFLLSGLSLCALPPFNGFVSEFLMYEGIFKAISTGDFYISIICILVVIVLAISGGLSIFAMTKAFGLSFLGSQRKEYTSDIIDPPKSMLVPAVINSILMLLLGLTPFLIFPEIYEAIAAFKYLPADNSHYFQHVDIYQKFGLLSGILVALSMIVFAIRRIQQKRIQVNVGPTWGCGYSGGTAKHQYTSFSFSVPLKRILSPILSQKNNFIKYPEEEIFPGERKFDVDSVDRLEKYSISIPIKFLLKIIPFVGLAQTGRIQHYLIYPVGFLILIVVMTAFNFI